MEEIFWDSIACYNEATWLWQIVITVTGALLALVLWFRPATWVKITTKVFMVFISLWIAFVYYMGYASGRDYSNVMTIFWCMIAASWIYDLATHFSSFQKSGKYSIWGIVMLLLTLAYPLVSLMRGLEFPHITTPVIPSAVALYMLGMLMTFNRKINFFAFLLILHWSVIAMSKISIFNIPEDSILAAACIPSLVIFFRNVIKGSDVLKPSSRTVSLLVLAVAMVLAGCMATVAI